MMADNKIVFNCENADNGEVLIIPIADVHLGNERFDETYFKAVVDYIEQTPNCYFLLNGDLIENTITECPASVFNDTLSPQSQIALISKYLSKIVAKKKCINITIGNHEQRSNKKVGINPMDMIVSHLSMFDETLPERYFPTGLYSFIRVPIRQVKGKDRNATFLLYNQHGTGGGSTLGGAIRKSELQERYLNCHCLIRSHTHKAFALPKKIIVPDLVNCTIKEEQAWLVSNGAFMDYWNGYGEMNGFEPQDNSMPVIKLKVIRHANGKKKIDYVDKQISVELKSKDWFLEQVKNEIKD